MPKRTDIQKILIIGAGPIVIGQGCEFDYSGVQACRALREEGYYIILINSNPATIMTDPSMADATYIEPIEWRVIEHIIQQEKPDAILPTMGGQTALNCALDLVKHGVLEKYGVEMIGATKEAIDKAEDRALFREAMTRLGLAMPRAAIAHNMEEAKAAQLDVGFPTIIRPSFTLGGTGGGIAYNIEEFEAICKLGLDLSPTNELLIEESIIGWKEYELEVVRDRNDNCIIICSIENIDPMGVHTGDSITVAPALTLSDKEYQRLRNAANAVLREIGVDTGGSNVQFAVNPDDGRLVVIEMNPRVSRSSALASKATGFPIAKVAAKLAVGYTLDELKNEITSGVMPASFEPTIDYVVTKIPRFNFDKFPDAEARLTTQMKSVGEVMAIGKTFQASLQKALRGLETGKAGLDSTLDSALLTLLSESESIGAAVEQYNNRKEDEFNILDDIKNKCRTPSHVRIWHVADAFRLGFSVEEIQDFTKMDPWYLAQIEDLILTEKSIEQATIRTLSKEDLLRFKQQGFSDQRLATLLKTTEQAVRQWRHDFNLHPSYKRIDSCAAEFSSNTSYLYSTYEEHCEAAPSDKTKIIVLGGGPNRIGQGIEFDYCCVHATMALQEDGYETIMVNCNPETVSTDYDVSDRLYFEPLTLEDVLEIVYIEEPKGVIVQYGGQTPLKLARELEAAGVPIIGTPPSAIDRAEDRERFSDMVRKLNILQPKNGIVRTVEEGVKIAQEIGYPIVVRPSYVLGGRAMEIVQNVDELKHYLANAVQLSNESPILLDSFLTKAIEVDIDAISDGENVYIAGIMEHIEQAGIHSGDSACSIPPFSLSEKIQDQLCTQMELLAKELGVIGLMNAQFAIQDNKIYIIEVNPRSSRTVPFVSKATGVPLAKIGARCMVGTTLADQGITNTRPPKIPFFAVKSPVFPFMKFLGVDPILGPEMKSTGEVMGIGKTFGEAYGKAQLAAGDEIPKGGKVIFSVRDFDKPHIIELAKRFIALGFEILATEGTAIALEKANVPCTKIHKVSEGRPHIVDIIKNGEVTYIVNTTEGRKAIADSFAIRRSALQSKVGYTTTIAGAYATIDALNVRDNQTYFRVQDLHVSSK